MSSIFDLDAPAQRARGAYWTTREILQQPAVWQDIAAQHAREQAELQAFLAPLLERPQLRIVLAGAGTSAFIGECLAPALARCTRRRVEAIATTDLIVAPRDRLEPAIPTLLVSFARSGNSPESVAAFDLADRCVAECAHLVITCNPDGALHRRALGQARARCILLPDAVNDRSFAMTSSFTGMLLAAALAFGAIPPAAVGPLAALGAGILPAWRARLQSLVAAGFERAVFLGSNILKGLAHEAALKMLELTDGRVLALGETPLGIRHGPKTMLNNGTLALVLLSSDPHTRRYDLDLLAELRREAVARKVLALSALPLPQPAHGDDLVLPVPGELEPDDLALCLPYAMLLQSLALLRSLSFGLQPDQPNVSGTVNRVVQGVTIHPWGPA